MSLDSVAKINKIPNVPFSKANRQTIEQSNRQKSDSIVQKNKENA